jgi:hypothetical protein
VKALDDWIKELAVSVDHFYSASRQEDQDPVPFFKTAELVPLYDQFLDHEGSEFKPAISARVGQLLTVLDA